MKKRTMAAAITAALVVASTGVIAPAAATEKKPLTGVLMTDIEIAPNQVSLKVSLDKTKVKKSAGKKIKLNAATNTDGYDVTFRSTDTKVATVSTDGVVKLKKKGTAKIVAECNGVQRVCKVTVKSKKKAAAGNKLTAETMSAAADSIGWQTQYVYPESSVMCSAYSFAYAYRQVTGVTRSAGSFWTWGGCNWDGGTYSRYGSSTEMLSAIKSSLDNNKACVGLLSTGSSSQHYVTFYGYENNGTTLSDFKILDPWDADITTGANYGYCWLGYHVVTVNG